MTSSSLTTFTDGLVQLRRALADADPFVATAEPAAFSDALRSVAGAVASAPEPERARYLLRALDEAIAAIEVAAQLADELHEEIEASETREAEPDALHMAYTRFAESQPCYQALYHYRNAVAEGLRGADDAGQGTDTSEK